MGRDVERVVRERHRLGVGLVPLDWRGAGASHRQHAWIEVLPRDGAARTDALRRESGDDSRAARQVEDALAGLQRGHLDQVDCQRGANGGGEVPLVVLGRVSGVVLERRGACDGRLTHAGPFFRHALRYVYRNTSRYSVKRGQAT